MARLCVDCEMASKSSVVVRPAFPFVIFDMDGTVVDSLELITNAYNFAAAGYLPRQLSVDEVLSMSGCTLEGQLTNYVPSDKLAASVDLYHEYFELNFNRMIQIYSGIRSLLFSLRRRGVKLAVYTGASKKTASHTLHQTELLPFFEIIVTGDDVTKPKPDPEGLYSTMDSLGASPDQTVYIGDHPNDLYALREAGVKCGAAHWGSRTGPQLERLNPDFAFKQPSEVLRLATFTLLNLH